MGNRAVISFKDQYSSKEMSPSIYLHWNGGRDSVESFLRAAKQLGIRGGDSAYCMSRLTQIIGNWIGGHLSLGVGCYGNLDTDNGNNGVYWIKDLEIVEREFAPSREQCSHNIEELTEEVVQANKAHFGEPS